MAGEPILMMWAHPRSFSTAFARAMVARGDHLVVHEPLCTLYDVGEVEVPGPDGAMVRCATVENVFRNLRDRASIEPLFVKETTDHRYEEVLHAPELVDGIRHAFLLREPFATIASHFAVNPCVSRDEIGYEHLHEVFRAVSSRGDYRPLVIDGDRFVAEPEAAIRRFCRWAGIPYRAEAMKWRSEARVEWSRTRKWHRGVDESTEIRRRESRYEDTPDNNAVLRSFLEYHRPFYDKLKREVDSTSEGDLLSPERWS